MGIYTITEFAEEIATRTKTRYGENYETGIETVTKNNGVKYTGIRIRKAGSQVAPLLYVDDAYDAYGHGMSLDLICEKLWAAYEQNSLDFDVSNLVNNLVNFDKVKDLVCYRLINAERNKEVLKVIPHISYLDFAIVFYVLVEPGQILQITNSHMELWKTDTEGLLKLAEENTKRLLGVMITPIEEVIREVAEPGVFTSEPGESGVYVAGNRTRINGAAALLYPEVLDQFAKEAGTDFYILPSSIHECLFLTRPIQSEEELKEMVMTVNGTAVEADEVLSDNVYKYDRKKQQIVFV